MHGKDMQFGSDWQMGETVGEHRDSKGDAKDD